MLIIADKPGQLGNRLFVFAHFLAAAMEHNFTFMNPAFDEYANYFPTTAQDLFCRYPLRRSFIRGRPFARKALYKICYYAARVIVRSRLETKFLRAVSLDWDEQLDVGSQQFLSTLKRRQIFFLQGWQFRNEHLLSKHADRVREFFQPMAEFRADVRNLIERARSQCDVLVGVHIRHGDYRKFQGGKYFYEFDVYASLMERAQAMFPGQRVAFLICSNATYDRETFSRFSYAQGTGHLIEDMYALAECDHIIGPPSTFTMWASFYGATPLYLVADPRRPLTLEDFVVHGVSGHTVAKDAPPVLERSA